MNLRRVLHVLGLLLIVLSGAQLVPLLWCLQGGEGAAVTAFLSGAGATGLLGAAFRFFGESEGQLYRREGVLIVVGAWVLASLSGAIPYVVSGVLPSVIDALFESSSGFTTTGATVIRDIEGAGHPLLFWRSFTQWLGGIGIVVLFVALLSELGPGARFLFKLEVPGPKAEVLHARVQDTALALGRIYVALTIAEVVVLLALGQSLFDALTHSFSTISTGGFSPHTESVAWMPFASRLAIFCFMIAAGVNFSLYFATVRQRDLRALRDTELRAYLGLLVGATGLVTAGLVRVGETSWLVAGFDAAFQVVAIVTTTGFATTDFAVWPTSARSVLVALMVVGGCAGSTAGGVKIVRVIVGWRAAMREVRLTFSPNSVVAIAVGRQSVPESSVRSVVALLILWASAWVAGTLLLSIGNPRLVTAATASLTTLSNVGPGLAAVGPSGDFTFFEPWQKLVMVLLMWLGRLEFLALLAVFQPSFWRR